MARRLSEEVLKVAGLSEDEGEGTRAAEKAAVEVHTSVPPVSADFRSCSHHWHEGGEVTRVGWYKHGPSC